MADHGLERPFLAGVQRLKRVEKLVTLLLLFILLTAATAGVTAVLTGPDWSSLWLSLAIGLLIGWMLGVFRLSAWRTALLVLALGVLFCLIFTGGLDEKVLAVFGQLYRLVGSLPIWWKVRHIDMVPLASAVQQLFVSLGVVLDRVAAWVKDLAAGQASFDPVAAGIMWSLVVWLVSAWAGWVVEAGHNAMLAMLPALGLNLATLSYGRSSSVTIYLMLGLALVLVAVVEYDHRQQDWEATRIAFPQHKVRQIGNTALLIAIGLVILAAILSSISLRQITQITSRLIHPASQPESGLAKSLGIQQPTAVPNSFSKVGSPGLPTELLIRASPKLLAEPVMSVEVNFLSSQSPAGQLPPFYWRSYTYDVYTGHGWSSSPTVVTQYQPNQAIQAADLPYHQEIQEVVNPVPGEAGTLYAAGEPVSVNVTASAARRSSNDLFGIQTGDTSYTVQSMIPAVSDSSLRTAGQDYPAWVTPRYLALPAGVTNRVKQLAIQLTATEPTPYDRANAIEQYLRSNYPYTLDVPYPPANQDLVDYFLFDLRKGYCDYYASAMVVLARAAGIPTRLAVGYASGTYNEKSGRFLVAQGDAHSWVEVYFPGIGWVPFEPTAANPAIHRSGQPTQPASPSTTPVVRPTPPAPNGIRATTGLSVALGLLAVVGIAWAVYDEAILAGLSNRQAAVEVYRRLRRYGRLLKVADEGGQTPVEYGFSMIERLSAFDTPKSIPSGRVAPNIQSLIQAIIRFSYRPSEAGDVLKIQMVRKWKYVRWQLRWMWARWMWQSISELFHFERQVPTGNGPGQVEQE